MAYETGISTGPADLMSKLATFATTNGWTVSAATVGAVFRNGTINVGYNTDSDEIFLRGGTSFNAGQAWDAQPNNPGYSVSINCGAGPFVAYHFFAGTEDTSTYLHAAVEFASGRYRHFSFGNLIKHGSYTGGTYVDGVNWNQGTGFINQPDHGFHKVICDANTDTSGAGHVYADFDTKTNNWVRMQGDSTFATTAGLGSVRSSGINNMFPNHGYARFNLRNLTAPLTYFANRASSLRSPLGRIPHMRQVGMANLEPGVNLSIGGDDWKCFPISQRTETWNSGSSTIESSGPYGYAYKL